MRLNDGAQALLLQVGDAAHEADVRVAHVPVCRAQLTQQLFNHVGQTPLPAFDKLLLLLLLLMLW